MDMNSDNLSEFEREFELDDELENTSGFDGFADESAYADSEAEYEYDEEEDMEYGNEEYSEESEFEDEMESWDRSNEQAYANRLYEAMTNGIDNEFEMEQAIDRVLYEMEQDFFFKKFKKLGSKFLQTAGGRLVQKLAKNSPWGIVASGLSKVARGDIQGAIKGVINNDLVKQAVSMMPGGGAIAKGMDVANQLMEGETPGVSKASAQKAVDLAKKSYSHLAKNMAQMTSVNQVNSMGKDAVKKAADDMKNHRKGMRKTQIPLKPGAIVTVHAGKFINIWQPQ
jgi:hypothetical protein